MALSELLETMTGSEKVEALPNGQVLVGFKLDDPWRVGVRLERSSPRSPWLVIETSVVVASERADIKGDAIRRLPLGECIARAKEAASRAASIKREGSPFGSVSRIRLEPFMSSARKTDLDYANLALEYVLLVQAGDRRPAATLAQKTGNLNSPGVWTNRITEARKRGLLTEVGRGEAGGELTEKAERLLGFEPPSE